MGAAIDAVGDVVGPIRKNPILLAGAALAGVVFLVGLLLALIPLLGSIVYGLIVVPVTLTGMVAMTNAAIGGSTSLGEFTGGMKEHGGDAITAYSVLFLVQLAVTFLVLVVAAIGSVGLFAMMPASSDPRGAAPDALAGASLVVVGLVILLGAVFALAFGLVQQFLDVAVVVGGEGGTDAVKEAWLVVRRGPVSVLGYLVVRLFVTAVAAIPAVALFGLGIGLASGPAADGQFAVAGMVFGLLGVVLLPLPFVASVAYHVGYYRRRRGDASADGSATERGRGRGRDQGSSRDRSRRAEGGSGRQPRDPQSEDDPRDRGAGNEGFGSE